MRAANKGFTLLELIVATMLSVIILEIAWKMLIDQKSNMVGIRQRLRAQAVAREALKTLESELRITGFGQQFLYAAGSQGRIDSLNGAMGLAKCPGMTDANGSSVVASDGASGGNDTLSIAYPTVVDPATGTVCSQIQWSRYYVDADTNLVRVTASTLAGLAASGNASIVAKGVDVFQIRLGASGGGASPKTLLTTISETCCLNTLNFSSTGAVKVQSGTTIKVQPASSSNWNFLSSVNKLMKAGERWRDTLTIEPNPAFFNDLHALGASLSAGLFSSSGGADATVKLLSIPEVDSSLSASGSGMSYSIDLVVPSDGYYRLGFKGVSKSTPSTALLVKSLNALLVGNPPGADWWKDPSQMLATDWSGVKQVDVIVLSRAESMDDARPAKFTGLANFTKGAGVAGEFVATDKQVRSIFDHVYPVGNNGPE